MSASVTECRLMTLPEAAAVLRYSVRTIRRLIDAGELRTVQLGPGRALRIPRDELEQLQARHGEALGKLREAEEALTRAPDGDARRLADWISNGERCERPQPSIYERQIERDAARMVADAVLLEIEKTLDRRVAYV